MSIDIMVDVSPHETGVITGNLSQKLMLIPPLLTRATLEHALSEQVAQKRAALVKLRAGAEKAKAVVSRAPSEVVQLRDDVLKAYDAVSAVVEDPMNVDG